MSARDAIVAALLGNPPPVEPACYGADPTLFDARTPEDAKAALRYCLDCPVQGWCHSVVDPARSKFDGVAAGRLWLNGRPGLQAVA